MRLKEGKEHETFVKKEIESEENICFMCPKASKLQTIFARHIQLQHGQHSNGGNYSSFSTMLSVVIQQTAK